VRTVVKVLGYDDVKNLIVGATILGTGGGGEPKEGLKILTKDLDSGRELKIVKASELDSESLVICAYFCGSIPPPGKKEAQPEFDQRHITKAFNVMERRLGKKISAVIPTEIGAENTAVALHLAAKLGVPAMDGDQVGRSAPELNQSSYVIFQVKATPSVITDPHGNIVVVEDYVNISNYESIVRSLAIASGGSVLVMDSPIKAEKAGKVAINNSVSRAIELGKVIEEARKHNKNPIEAAIKFVKGFKVFTGFITSYSLKVEYGFLMGEIEIKGSGEWKGHSFRIWVKNENIIGWRDGRVAVMPPDLICMIDDNGYGITNSQVRIGMKVNIIGVKAHEIWRTPQGIELFGPRHFGFDYDYVPIEKLLNEI